MRMGDRQYLADGKSADGTGRDMEGKKVAGVLRGNNFAFKKQYGQNFIYDEALLSRIVSGAGVDKDTTVIEIGCGAGTLTAKLAGSAKYVYGYEIDSSLRPVLASTLAGVDNAEIIFRDFTRVRLDELEKTLPEYVVVANLPYYITTPLIMTFVENSVKCKSLTVMVQEEVARRLCAEAGTADYGAITANIALRGSAEIIMKVGREYFHPVPNVDSAVVRIELGEVRKDVRDVAMYKKCVQAAFGARRKTLENNLINVFGFAREQAECVLESCGIPRGVRGETLSPDDFARLAAAVGEALKG